MNKWISILLNSRVWLRAASDARRRGSGLTASISPAIHVAGYAGTSTLTRVEANQLPRSTNRIEAIDYLRALMSVLVVLWHVRVSGSSPTVPKHEYLQHTLTLADVFNFHILLLAVPTFIFISSYLYVMKGATAESLWNRLKRLAILLTFWPAAWLFYKRGYYGIFELVPQSVESFVSIVLQAGGTIYYFFTSLMICLVVTHVAAMCTTHVQTAGFFLSAASLSWMPQFGTALGLHSLSEYWSPINFIPLSFAAVLVAQNQEYILTRKTMLVAGAIALSLLFAKFEWNYSAGDTFFPGDGYAVPPYTRTSLVFSVLALAIIALGSGIKSNAVVNFMAKYSLALYCLHQFFIEPVKVLMAKVFHNQMVFSYSAPILIILLSYSSAIALRVYLKDEVLL